MDEKPYIDTEPDDAFAAILGDIDCSPLMQTPEEASPAPSVEAPTAPDDEPEAAPAVAPVTAARPTGDVESLRGALQALSVEAPEAYEVDFGDVMVLEADGLAVLLGFANFLDAERSARLAVVNASEELVSFFQKTRLCETYALDLR